MAAHKGTDYGSGIGSTDTAEAAETVRKQLGGGLEHCQEPVARPPYGLVSPTVVANLSCVVLRAFESSAPATFSNIAAAFSLSTTQLGMLSCAQQVVQAVTSLILGLSGLNVRKMRSLTLSCATASVATLGVGMSQTALHLLLMRALTGVASAVQLPVAISVLSDSYGEDGLGSALGVFMLLSCVGAVVGSYWGTVVAGYSLGPLPGWRVVFLSLGLAGCVATLVMYCAFKDPTPSKEVPGEDTPLCDDVVVLHDALPGQEVKATPPLPSRVATMMQMVSTVAGKRSFSVLVFCGCLGSMPWTAFSFLTMWLQAQGYSSVVAGSLTAIFVVGCSVGALAGGWLVDKADRRWPRYGCIAIMQMSVFLAIPLSWALFNRQSDSSSVVSLGVLLLLLGSCVTWVGPAQCLMLSAIVPRTHQVSVFALDRSIECLVAAGAPSLAGYLAEHYFGYHPAEVGKSAANAKALGQALIWTSTVPWGLSLLATFALYVTYHKDRVKLLFVVVEGA